MKCRIDYSFAMIQISLKISWEADEKIVWKATVHTNVTAANKTTEKDQVKLAFHLVQWQAQTSSGPGHEHINQSGWGKKRETITLHCTFHGYNYSINTECLFCVLWMYASLK